jgi:hypothetical protein
MFYETLGPIPAENALGDFLTGLALLRFLIIFTYTPTKLLATG